MSISPWIPLVPSVSEQTQPGSRIQTNIVSSESMPPEPMKEMLYPFPLCNFYAISDTFLITGLTLST